MSYLLTSQVKQPTGKILDAAARKPQFAMRDGALFDIAKVNADAALLVAAEQATVRRCDSSLRERATGRSASVRRSRKQKSQS